MTEQIVPRNPTENVRRYPKRKRAGVTYYDEDEDSGIDLLDNDLWSQTHREQHDLRGRKKVFCCFHH